MRYSINNYVGAFADIIKKVPHEKAVDGFLKLLAKTGDLRHSKKIIEAIHKKLVKEDGGKWVNIETARQMSSVKTTAVTHKFLKKDHLDFKINSELIAGMRVTINGEEEINGTLQNKLSKLFK